MSHCEVKLISTLLFRLAILAALSPLWSFLVLLTTLSLLLAGFFNLLFWVCSNTLTFGLFYFACLRFRLLLFFGLWGRRWRGRFSFFENPEGLLLIFLHSFGIREEFGSLQGLPFFWMVLNDKIDILVMASVEVTKFSHLLENEVRKRFWYLFFQE